MGVTNSKLDPRVSPSNQNDSTSAVPHTLQSNINSKFIIVWLDADVNDFDVVYQNSLARLERIFISLHTFTNMKDCNKYLSSIKNEMIIMVVSDEFFDKIWPRIKTMSQVHSVYILSPYDEKITLSDEEYVKVKGVFTRVEPLCSAIKRGTRHYNKDSLVMSIIPSIKYTKKDLPQINQLFIYWMLVKQIILETKYDTEESIKDLITFCRSHYFSNQNELTTIEEFEKNYHKHSPIWWYTKDSFIFIMLSRALQTQDIEIIIRMGFFIKDLNQQLEKLQGDTLKNLRLPIVSYRSQNVSNEDFEKIKNIKGQLLSFNNFMMADTDAELSINLARHAQRTNTGVGLLFCLRVESKHTSSAYASLHNFSHSPDKGKYILFSMHSVFRIVDMKQIENLLWQIDLVLTTANDEHIASINELLHAETKDSAHWFKLAELMSVIRDFDHAKDIYYALLELIPETEVLKMANIYNELGVLEDQAGDYVSALSFYQKSIDIRQKFLPPNHRSLSVAYNNMGEVQRQMGDYYGALTSHKKTLDIKQKSLTPNHLSFATTYNNIGLTNESLGEYKIALEFYQKAMEVKRRALPQDHQELATTYNNIGELHRCMGNYPAALTNLEKALKIRLRKYAPTDPSLAITYNNMGLIHRELGNFPKALQYLNKSLEVKMKNFPPNHPSLAFTHNNLGDVHETMGEYTQGLASYQTALDIQEKSLPPTHPDIAISLTNIGVAHQSMGDYKKALEFYEKALKLRENALPAIHPSIGTSYNNLGHLYQLMGEYSTALDYYQKTLKLQEKTLPSNHPATAASYNNLADIYRKVENHKKALQFYRKSLDIKKASLPPYHPALVITYNNMGVMNQATGNFASALECYKQTLEIQKRTLPDIHPDLAAVYNNIGTAHQSLKQYEEALENYKKALKIQEKSLPPNHPDLALSNNSMATILVVFERYQEALKHSQRAVEIGSRTLAPDHPNLLTYRNYHERIRIKVESMKKK